LASDSLDGLSVGDALGAQFFMVGRSIPDLVAGRPPAAPWEWTDDTHMAGSGWIVAASTGIGDRPDTTGVPPAWLAAREPLPGWASRR
jgi:hypothetical protein